MTADRDVRSPFEMIGGSDVIRQIVDRFYDLMDADTAYGELRALHADDLTQMRGSLTGFLIGWMGGPGDWFIEHPGKCMMSMHRQVGVDQTTADQWARAMAAAIRDCGVEPDLADRMMKAFSAMAAAMAGRS